VPISLPSIGTKVGRLHIRQFLAVATAVALLSACGAIEYQSDLIRPAATGRPYTAGIGDTVIDLKRTQSLPNAFGKADIFGRTRDAGRVIVRLVGLDGNQATFVRQDVVIQSNESTLTQGPMMLPTYESSTVYGTVGSVPVSATRSGWGTAWLPPATAYSYPLQAGQTPLTAPIGGSVPVEGRWLNVLRRVGDGIEYSVD
jgi:hypothetical protein